MKQTNLSPEVSNAINKISETLSLFSHEDTALILMELIKKNGLEFQIVAECTENGKYATFEIEDVRIIPSDGFDCRELSAKQTQKDIAVFKP